MTTVVTGASGHLGANLVRALISRGRPVRAMVHVEHRALDGLHTETVQGDISNPDSLLKAFKGAEVVYHLAASISLLPGGWTHFRQINVDGTRNVVEACLRGGVRRLVHVSSIHALDTAGAENGIMNESCRFVGKSGCPPYDRSKAYGEQTVYAGIQNGLDAVIVTPTGIIGPNDFGPSHFGQVLIALSRGKLPGLVSGGFDWVDVRDVVQGALQAEDVAPSGSKYILSGHRATMIEIARIVRNLTGTPSPRFVAPLWLAAIGAPFTTVIDLIRGTQPLYTSVSIRAIRTSKIVSHEKATHELGYHPRPFEETIKDTLVWYKDHGMINPVHLMD